MPMLLLYVICSLARILDAHLVRASILSAHKIRSSLRISTSTANTFDTRRSGIRKVHAVYTYPRKCTCLDTTWILLRSGFYEIMLARFHLIRIHLARCISRRSCREAHKDNDNPDNTNYPSSRRDKSSLPTYKQDVLKILASFVEYVILAKNIASNIKPLLFSKIRIYILRFFYMFFT